ESAARAIDLSGTLDHIHVDLNIVSPAGGVTLFNTGVALTNCFLRTSQRNGAAQPLINASSGVSTAKGCQVFEGTLSGSGAAASNITLTESIIQAPGVTDANVNTFNAASQYMLFDDTGVHAFFGGGPRIFGST